MTPRPQDKRLRYAAAAAGVILVLLVIAWAAGWFGGEAPPETAPAPTTTQ
jgi:hypothetical protein